MAIQIAPDENDQVADWKARGKYTFPVLLVPAAMSDEQKGQGYSFKRFGVWGAPTNLLVNADRKVVFRHAGGIGAALEIEIRDLLGLPPFDGLD